MTPAAAQATQAFMAAAERTTPLYALSAEYLDIVRVLEQFEEPDVVSAELELELDQIKGAIEHKAESIAGLMAWQDGLAAMRRAEEKRMAASAAVLERRSERLKTYVLKHMQATGLTRIDTARFTLAIALNPPSVDVFDAAMVPSEFQRTTITTEVDKVAVRKHTKATGELVPGTRIVRTERLDIK